jgi:acyl-CoA thioester hydrolase
MEGYNTELILRIDWSEMDLFGHVNNVSFFKYIQASRVNYWEKIGMTQFHNNNNKGPMLASTNCKFKQPLFYPGKVIIKCKVGFIKTTSFSIEHLLFNDKGDVVAEAEDIVVYYDFTKHEKEPIPLFLRDKIQSVEEKEF